MPRLKKSGIEYVILVGSSLFTLSGLNSDMIAEGVRDFFTDFSFFALGIANFRSPSLGKVQVSIPSGPLKT